MMINKTLKLCVLIVIIYLHSTECLPCHVIVHVAEKCQNKYGGLVAVIITENMSSIIISVIINYQSLSLCVPSVCTICIMYITEVGTHHKQRASYQYRYIFLLFKDI